MNQKERERLKVIIRFEEDTLNQDIAARQLRIGVRQLQRLIHAYRKNGEKTLVSKRRGRRGNYSFSENRRNEIAMVIAQNYPDFGPTFAHEMLVEKHGIVASISSVRNIMVENKIWSPKKVKTVKVHQRRAPRECYGELEQMDGSYHDWFEGRAPECCLIVVIDDATSRLMWLQFVKWESCVGYFQAIKEYIKKHGKPMSIYTDRLAVFETTRKTDKNYKDTQVHRALTTLGIDLILAGSPQAVNQNLPTQNSTRKRMGSSPAADTKIIDIEKNVRAENKIEAEAEKINPDSVKNLTDNLNDKKLSKEKLASSKILKTENINSFGTNKSKNIEKLQNKINNLFKDSSVNPTKGTYEDLSVSELDKIIEKRLSGEEKIIVNISENRIKFKIGIIDHEDDAVFSNDRIILTEAQKIKHGHRIDNLPFEFHKSITKAHKQEIEAFKENKKYSVITEDKFNILKNANNTRFKKDKVEKSKTDVNNFTKSSDNFRPDFSAIGLISSKT